MNRSESKYFNTAVRMNEALLSLLEVKDYQYITIKEICETAQVNRSTFYLHYETIDDLLTETIDYTMQRLVEKFARADLIDAAQITAAPVKDLVLITPDYLVPYLEFVRENRKIFTVAVTQPSVVRVGEIFNMRYTDTFEPIMRRFGMDRREMRYRLAFYLNGMFAAITEWIKGGCTDDIEYMTDLLIRSVFPRTDDIL